MVATNPGTVIFDFDGVFLRSDSTAEFVRRRLVAAKWKFVATAPTLILFGSTRYWPAMQGYLARHLLWIVLLGADESTAEAELRQLGADLAVHDTRSIAQAFEALEAHLAHGDAVLINSASLEPFLRAFFAARGLESLEIVGSKLRSRSFGLVMAEHNFHGAKVRRAVAEGWDGEWDVVYSDSLADMPMLRRGARSILINPSRRAAGKALRMLGAKLTVVRWR